MGRLHLRRGYSVIDPQANQLAYLAVAKRLILFFLQTLVALLQSKK